MLRISCVCVAVLTMLTLAGPVSAQSTDPEAKVLTRAEIEAGWISLFDGETLFGWKANTNVNWSVFNGSIEADKGDAGLLLTTSQFSEYEFRCDFWMEKGGNSGVFLQSIFEPKDPTTDCYELNICDTHPAFGTGSLVGLVKPAQPVIGDGVWKTFHVTVHKNTLQVKLNDDVILKYTNPSPQARKFGYVGLQKNSGHVKFKNIFLRPLGTQPLFNGKNLDGWRTVAGGVSEFKVSDGTIHVTNGRGYLETVNTYDDFILQADCRTNGDHLNSGIFFRAIAGTEKNPADGYECQIRHEWMGDDRTKPVDFGTGGIYRRIATRKVVGTDREWCTMTILAQGPHMAVWVDGYQTTDWVDDRKPNPNPRNGLRLEAGHISLQGHDPTTDLNFRHLRLVALPKIK